MRAPARTRGQPLVVFATILGGWTILRVLLWTPPFPDAVRTVADTLAPAAEAARDWTGRVAVKREASGDPRTDTERHAADALWPETPAPYATEPGFLSPPPAWMEPIPTDAGPEANELAVSAAPVRGLVSHFMLLAAGMSNLALPPEIAAFYGRRGAAPEKPSLAAADRPLLGTPVAQLGAAAPASRSRWSGDAWLLWREDRGASAAAPGSPAYGRSQAGAVARYRLASGPLRPTAYARASHTLQGPRQRELALGLSARPLRALPVSMAAEARVTETVAGRELRPSAFAVTELPPLSLPLGLRAEAYLQGGWVGGRDATAFVDGQARVDRQLARIGGENELRAGLAAWGGAQKGAARLDIGPSATLGFRLGEANSRIAVDYRFRVAGEAAPKSGPAVTFSAGF